MAEKEKEEKKEEKGEKKEGEKAPRSPKMLIIIIAASVVLAGGGGYFFMSKSGSKEVKAGETKSSGHGEPKGGHEKKAEGKATAGFIHPLDTFIVNLADPSRTRYLKVTVQLELDNDSAIEEVKSKTPQVRDALIILFSSKGIDEIATAEGKYQLRDEIIARVNQFMTRGKVESAYFTDLVVQ